MPIVLYFRVERLQITVCSKSAKLWKTLEIRDCVIFEEKTNFIRDCPGFSEAQKNSNSSLPVGQAALKFCMPWASAIFTCSMFL